MNKRDVAAVIAERRNMSEEQAMQIVNGWDERLSNAASSVSAYAENVQDRVPEVAENIAGEVAKVAFYTFLALLLGAVAAAFGGITGRQLDAALPGEPALAASDVR